MTKLEETMAQMTPEQRKKAVEAISDMIGMPNKHPKCFDDCAFRLQAEEAEERYEKLAREFDTYRDETSKEIRRLHNVIRELQPNGSN